MLKDRVKAYRLLRELSQEALAELMGFPANTISKIEHGTRKLTFEEAIRLTEIFEVSLQELVGLPPSSPEAIALKNLALQCTQQMHAASGALSAATAMVAAIERLAIA